MRKPFVLTAVLSLILTACSISLPQRNQAEAKGAASVAIIGGQLSVVGDKVRIILPTDSLFINGSARLSLDADYYLAKLVGYLRQFSNRCITITGYTDAMPDKQASKLLALQRAQKIAGSLWAAGFTEPYLQVRGLGQEAAVADNLTVYGRAYNRRIEITFWQR